MGQKRIRRVKADFKVYGLSNGKDRVVTDCGELWKVPVWKKATGSVLDRLNVRR